MELKDLHAEIRELKEELRDGDAKVHEIEDRIDELTATIDAYERVAELQDRVAELQDRREPKNNHGYEDDLIASFIAHTHRLYEPTPGDEGAVYDEVVEAVKDDHDVHESVIRGCGEFLTGRGDIRAVGPGTIEPTPAPKRTVRRTVARLEGTHGNGVPTDHVVDHVTSTYGIDEERVRDSIESLKQTGEVYEPHQNRL